MQDERSAVLILGYPFTESKMSELVNTITACSEPSEGIGRCTNIQMAVPHTHANSLSLL